MQERLVAEMRLTVEKEVVARYEAARDAELFAIRTLEKEVRTYVRATEVKVKVNIEKSHYCQGHN